LTLVAASIADVGCSSFIALRGVHRLQIQIVTMSAKSKSKRGASRPGTERARDEQRDTDSPRYAGGPWRVADERGDRRFGHARTDEAENDDDESPSAADPELADAEAAGEIESGGERSGMGRGEKPRKSKDREKP